MTYRGRLHHSFGMDNGLLTISLRVPTEEELLMCPVVTISSDDPWDPSNLAGDVNISCRINALLGEVPEATNIQKLVDDIRIAYTLQHKGFTNESYKALRPYLGWIPESRVKSTIENTSALAKLDTRLPLRRHLKSRYPQLKFNRKRLPETYCTDTMFASKKSIEGYTCAQLFVGKSSKYTAVYGMRLEDQGTVRHYRTSYVTSELHTIYIVTIPRCKLATRGKT